jgi:hypothetical protein
VSREPEGDPRPDEVIEIASSTRLTKPLIATFVVIGACGPVVLPFVARSEPLWFVLSLTSVCWFSALLVWLSTRRPLIRADASGLLGFTGGLGVRQKLVPWSDIASCEIITLYDPWGEATLAAPVLKDIQGRKLVARYFPNVAKPDQERLIKFIKAKLPKTVVDPWDEPL